MDYSYFSAGPQPYQFFGLPPTPGQSNTPPPGDYSRPVLSPVRINEDPPNRFPTSDMDAAFAAFQQNFRYDPTSFGTQHRNSLSQSPTKSPRKDSTISIPDGNGNGNGLQPIAADLSYEDQQRARSSSEEKESLTPAQSRRKAQNRAAQRAFRERKERHVKDLEAKLTTLEQQSTSLNSENERLKRELAKIATENEILRATSGGGMAGPHPYADDSDEITSTGPLHYTPRDFYSKLDLSNNKGSPLYYRDKKCIASQRITVSADSGERLLAAGATWDYIQQHELFQKGLVDVGDVCERLKKLARCDGQGPVFEECDIRKAIKESAVAGGRDELI